MVTTSLIAVDLGASSGRVAHGTIDGSRVVLEELHRFATPSIEGPDGLRWDVDSLTREIVEGIRRGADAGIDAVSVGIDTWGVDYGLLDEDAELIAAPFHHRDRRTSGIADRLDGDFLFRQTGVQCQDINTLTQLLTERPEVLARARTLLFMPDLLGQRLSGGAATDATIASTSQLLAPDDSVAIDVLARYGLPDLLPRIVAPGTVLGDPLAHLASAGFRGVVTTIAGHDTACAVAAIPTAESPTAFVSCGTWGLVGLELDHADLSAEALAAGFTNERGYGSHHLLRNASGLWLLNECIREWGASATVNAPALAQAAASALPLRSIIDPMDPVFLPRGGMPQRIAAYCAEHDQPVPSSRAEIVRCILDSLALGFARTIADASTLTRHSPTAVHIVGGGSRIPLLCSMTASLTGLPVVAGPAEATLVGNLLIQARALGVLSGADAVREVAAASLTTTTYLPEELRG